MDEDRGKVVISINPTNYKKHMKGNLLILIVFSGVLWILFFLFLSGMGLRPLTIFLLYFALLPNIILIPSLLSFYFEPLIIFNKGFIKGETKIKSKLFQRSSFIEFKEIVRIDTMSHEKSYIWIRFILKNKKVIYQFINNEKEFGIIKATYEKNIAK